MEPEDTYKTITTEEELKELLKDSKNDFRDWLNNKFPKGYVGYNIYYLLFHPWKIFEYWSDQIKYAWQRVTNGFDERAIWSIDYYIANLIVKLLTQFKERHHGVPSDMFEGMPYEDEQFYTHSEENWKIADEKWCNILQEIIDGFEEYLSNDINYDCYKSKKFKKSFDLFKKHFVKFWD
jgi:hypothetical protein